MIERVSIFWFRRDLRLQDNVGLLAALSSRHPVLPIFIFDTFILEKLENKADRRVDFIINALVSLNNDLSKHGSSLQILYSSPLEAFQRLVNDYDIEDVYCNHDYEPYSIDRDNLIQGYLSQRGINFRSYKDHVIFEKLEIAKPNGLPYTIFTPYSKRWKESLTKISQSKSESYLYNLAKVSSSAIPTLKDIGFQKTKLQFSKPFITDDLIINYHKYRDFPSINGTSKLGVHLRFGTISIRQAAIAAINLNDTWLNELIWREFFMSILYNFPFVANRSFKEKYESIQWINNKEDFNKWCNGVTGYPIVDAGMRELNTTGFMHNRVRMITASFLTKDLLIDWRLGEAYFASKLDDYELSSNNGNWQWAAGCGCDASPYFRIFSPLEQTKKFDKHFEYIKKWVPEYNSSRYSPKIIDHSFARERALKAYKKEMFI